MARQMKNRLPKKIIYVFWEGESEKAYVSFLKQEFSNRAVIYSHREKGTFYTAQAFYRGNKRFRSDMDEIDEIWFFFDTEIEKSGQWKDNISCISSILNTRGKRNRLRVRLLMTSCCLEYWLLLHYEQTAPAMATVADKALMLDAIKQYVPNYKKGDRYTTCMVAKEYAIAIRNGHWTLSCLQQKGMPINIEERDRWLYSGNYTFTTVHEAIEMLVSLPDFQ